MRAVGLAVSAAAAVALLTSCAQLGGAAGAGGESTPPPTASSPAAASSAPAATPSASASAPSATPVPAATDPAPSPLPTSSADGRAAVVPFVTAASASGTALDVGAIVPSVIESDGRCTATATSGDITRTATGAGIGASSYTGCEAMRITDVTPGTWQVHVRYDSATASGVSAVRSVTVG